jgi:hypothetical protein
MNGVDLLSINPATDETKQLVGFRWEGGKLVARGKEELVQEYTERGITLAGKTYKLIDGDDFLQALVDKHLQSTRRITRIVK